MTFPKLANHRYDPAALFGRIHLFGPGSGRFSTDVDDPGPGIEMALTLGDSGFGSEKQAPVRERIGCRVDDTHDHRPTRNPQLVEPLC